MRVIVTVPSGFLNDIKSLVNEGKYSGLEEFIEVAIYNQLNLEKEPSVIRPNLDVKMQVDLPKTNLINNEKIWNKVETVTTLRPSQLVELLPDYHDIGLVEPPNETKLMSGVLWGQYNKIFPIKLTTRILANVLKNNNFLSLDDFKETASDAARRLGISILDVDKSKRRKKGERLSTALPVGDEPYKSMTRFKNHFIGGVDRKGILFGAPFKLKFINLVEGDGTQIGITKYGLAFAQLKNPLLDDSIKSNNSLSKDEISFFIDHVFDNLKEESNGIITILKGIIIGNNDPEKLTSYISTNNEHMQKAEASIVRTGLVSRMIELELISSTRVGMRQIEYVITPSGEELLRNRGGD